MGIFKLPGSTTVYPGTVYTGYGYVAGLRAEALSMSDVYLNLDINKFIKLDT